MLNHISKPLRRQMNQLIDRTRWPVLVTYSDEGQGHTGHVYKCSGWEPAVRNQRPVYQTADGERASSYSNGRHGSRDLERAGTTVIQRWEHRVCEPGFAALWMLAHGWQRVEVPGKTWRSGRQRYEWVRS